MQPSSRRPPSLTHYASYLSVQVAKAAGRVITDGLSEHGLRLSSYAVLAALTDHGPQCQRELCERLDLDKSHMVGFVDELEDAGLVVRQPDPADRRRHRVAITRTGHERLAALHAVERRCADEVFGALSPAERATLIDLLRKVVEAADAERLAPAEEAVS